MKGPNTFNSAAFRFALLIAGLFALGSIAILAVVQHSLQSYAAEATAIGLRAETAALMDVVSLAGNQQLALTIRRRQQLPYEAPFQYLLTGADGSVLAGDLPAAAAQRGWGRVVLAGDRGDAETLQSLGTRLPDGSLLVVATDNFDVQQVRGRVVDFTIGSSVAIAMLVLVGGYFIGLTFLRRLGGVNHAVARIMSGRLDERLPAIGMGAEFDELSQNLNAMLEWISTLMDGLRQVSTDIAHDLRMPLTRLQQQLETMRGSASVAVYEAGIEQSLAQIDFIHTIFRALLRIGLLEGGGRSQPFPQFDLSELVGRVAEAYRPVVEDAGKTVEIMVDSGIHVPGDGELLAQLLANLVDNAVVHTPEGTRIEVSLHREGDGAVVTVADDGPGVPESERSRILRRFYRLDQSRSTAGAGLGLAMVAAIAGRHGAKLSIENNNPGLRVRLGFSAASTRASG